MLSRMCIWEFVDIIEDFWTFFKFISGDLIGDRIRNLHIIEYKAFSDLRFLLTSFRLPEL